MVANTMGFIGRFASSTGVATVTDSGSQWNNSETLYVGDDGTGMLNVELGGVDVVHNVAPPPHGDVDLAQVKMRFGDRVCLRGNFDSEGAAEHGTPEQVDEAVRDLIMTAAPGGRYILACSDTITADWPEPNIRAFFNAARKYGDYEHLCVA